MKYWKLFFCAVLLFAFPMNSFASKPNQVVGLDLGLFDGVAWQIHWKISNFAQDFPASIRLGIGHSVMDPGNSAAARRIFINNATNGTPEEHGSMWNYRLDVLLPIVYKKIIKTRPFFGPRYASYKGNFKYVGGNEDFDVVSKHWGIGVGLESTYVINKKVAMRFSTGLDFYKSSTLKGHDTEYSPDGSIVNQREDYTYKDANRAINQPGFELRIMAGFLYKL